MSDLSPASAFPASTYASVIVIAHNRRKYLRQAIESVLSQDVDRNRFELIVVKNFPDVEIDSLIERVNARGILCEALPATQKVAEGFRLSKGDVLFFLDDDDLFEPYRLRTVLAEFDCRPDLGFYHNQVTFIGPDGSNLSRERVRALGLHVPRSSQRIYIDGTGKPPSARAIADANPEFNASSTAIRRELFVRGSQYLPRLRMILDTLLWYEALASDRPILLDNQRLTRYRIHGDNLTLPQGKLLGHDDKRALDFTRIADGDYNVVKDFVVSTGNQLLLRQIKARIVTNQLTMRWRDLSSARSDFLPVLREAVQYVDTPPIRGASHELLGALVYLVSPKLARKIHERRAARE